MDELLDHQLTVSNAEKWLKTVLVNWESYEPLDWSQVIHLGYPPYKYILSHKFVHVNAMGNRERCTITLYMDEQGKVINFSKWEQYEV